jgi:hypothetical protein
MARQSGLVSTGWPTISSSLTGMAPSAGVTTTTSTGAERTPLTSAVTWVEPKALAVSFPSAATSTVLGAFDDHVAVPLTGVPAASYALAVSARVWPGSVTSTADGLTSTHAPSVGLSDAGGAVVGVGVGVAGPGVTPVGDGGVEPQPTRSAMTSATVACLAVPASAGAVATAGTRTARHATVALPAFMPLMRVIPSPV